MKINLIILAALDLIIGGCDASGGGCKVGISGHEINLRRRAFEALISHEGRPLFWIEGCRNAYLIHPTSHNALRTMDAIASAGRNGAAFSGILNGRIVYLKSINQSVVLIDSIAEFHVQDYTVRDSLEERLANDKQIAQ